MPLALHTVVKHLNQDVEKLLEEQRSKQEPAIYSDGKQAMLYINREFQSLVAVVRGTKDRPTEVNRRAVEAAISLAAACIKMATDLGDKEALILLENK